MARKACDGAGFLAAFRAAVANLEASVDEINALNVYPVPDGDTGSNMAATVRAALAEGDAAGPSAPVERVASAISFGALMGARGNSGVITSQILRGMAEGLATKTRFTGPDLAHALATGSEAAYRAVARPVEGTILTVIREASAAAVACADGDGDLEAVLGAAVDAAEKAVAKTPTLLAILREAGVVDSGGQGLFRLLQGAQRFLQEGSGTARKSAAAPRRGGTPAAPARQASTLVAHADEGFGYETMFLLQARPGASLDLDAIRTHLEGIGESVLVAGDPRAIKVHVHNERPDLVIAYGLALGALSRISVENLDGQVHDVRERRAGEFTRAEAADEAPVAVLVSGGMTDSPGGAMAGPDLEPGGRSVATDAVPGSSSAPLHLAVVAVVAGDGLEAIFRDFGVTRIVRGGQTANPSTGELLKAIEATNAREVLLLPNNPNVILAARQVAAMADRPVEIVPTRNAAEGFAALLALDPTRGAADNAAQMTDKARAIQTLAVTEAVRDSSIGGRRVKKGQVIALDPDDGLVAVDNDAHRCVTAAVATLNPGYELLTIYYGDGAGLADAEELAHALGGDGRVEVQVVHGGQPYYRYLVAAE